MRDQEAWLCFEDESGQLLRPPKARTWSGAATRLSSRSRAAGPGRISFAGQVCRRLGRRTRLIFRMLMHHGRSHEKKGFREKDFARLLDAVHQQLGGDIVLLWDNCTHHVDAAMRELIAARQWLTVFRFPCTPPTSTGRERMGPPAEQPGATWPRAASTNSPRWPAPA